MRIEENSDVREDVAGLQLALDALEGETDTTKRDQMVGLMLLMTERIMIRIEDELRRD